MFRRIYYNKTTGNKILTYSFKEGNYNIPTFEQDKLTFDQFNGLNDDVIGVIEFTNGEYEQDFKESMENFRVNLDTVQLEFSYPDPNAPEEPQPYQLPLSKQVKELEVQLKQTNDDLAAFIDYQLGGM